MSDIFRRSAHRRMREAGEDAPVVGYDKPTGAASSDLGATPPAADVKGGPSSSFTDPADKELEERRKEQERIRQEAIARERAKQAAKRAAKR